MKISIISIPWESSAWNFTRSLIPQDFFYTLGRAILRYNWEYYSFTHFFSWLECVKNLLSYVFSRNKTFCTFFPTHWLLLIVIDKFANRNTCGYCFNMFRKIFTGTSASRLSVMLLPANMGFVNYSWLNFSLDFQNTELSRGVLQK